MKSEVLKELPPKTENLHRIELDEQQRKLYLAAVVDAREKLRAAKPEDKMAVFAVLMRLREICCDPRLVADNWDGGSAKLDACMELVTAAVEGGHRILLFSQFTSMLELLAKRLDEAGVSHFTLQGSTPKPVRAELVRRFNSGEADVFLISPTAPTASASAIRCRCTSSLRRTPLKKRSWSCSRQSRTLPRRSPARQTEQSCP